ncbi:MAG TPA: PQQ-binding-like beta-propeller repeat protein [Ktedonosporobacter sp.]|nr:PQQ-binding-like beta-propeller repeat protein [Ktedonosporobacter sp.]
MAGFADRVGQRFGNYLLRRLLGCGGFAHVYLGEHIYIGTRAAIKILDTQLPDKEFSQFRREARTIARLEHTNIVRVLEFGLEENTAFLAMTYAPYGTVRDHCPRGHRMPLSTALSYTSQVALALQYAHDKKIIHRDVKPENILLGSSGQILLSDFGLALEAHSSRSQISGQTAGTPTYMAPEQCAGRPCPASDQYALAMVVYEWLTGRHPFHGTPIEVQMQQITTIPPPLREMAPDLPAAVEKVVMTALAKDHHLRFSSVIEFARALQEACGQPIASDDALPGQEEEAFSASNHPAEHSSDSEQESATQPGRGETSIPTQLPATPPTSPMPLPNSDSPPVWSLPSVEETPKPTRADAAYPPMGPLKGGDPTRPVAPMPSTPDPIPPGTRVPPGPVGSPPLGQQADKSAGSHDEIGDLYGVGGGNEGSAGRRLRVGISRRAVLLVAAGLAGAAVVGSAGIWVAHTLLVRGDGQGTNITPTNPVAIATVADPSLSSVSAMFGYDLQHTHCNPAERILSPANVARLVPYWTTSAGWLLGALTLAHGVLYAGTQDGKLCAFNARSGQLLWTASTSASISSSPAVATLPGGHNALVYIASADGNVYACDTATGRTVWTAQMGGHNYSSPAIANGILYIGSSDYKVYAFDATSGQALWATSTSYTISSSPALDDGILYIGAEDGTIYALHAFTGQILWTAATHDMIFSCSPTIGHFPTTIDHFPTGTLPGASPTSTSTDVSSVDASPPNKWTADHLYPSGGDATTGGTAAPGSLVYIGTNSGTVYAFDASSGHVVWTAFIGGRIAASPALLNAAGGRGGTLYICSGAGAVVAFDALTGKTLWTATAGTNIFASPTLAAGVLYVTSLDHKLYAFNATTGQALWNAPIGGDSGAPIVSNGIVYAGSQSGLYAFHLA